MFDRRVMCIAASAWTLIVSLAEPAAGQEKWLESLHRATALHREGHSVQAARICEEATKQARAGAASDADLELIQFQQALIEIDAGNPRQSAARMEVIWRSRQNRLGPLHPETLVAQLFLGQAYAMTGDLNQGLSLLGPVARDLPRLLGADAPEVLVAEAAFAIALSDAGAPEKADKILSATVARIRKSPVGRENILSVMLGHLGTLKAMQHDTGQARRLVREALEIRRKAAILDHPRSIALYQTLGQAEIIAGRPKAALAALDEALVLAGRFWPPEHSERGALYVSLGLARLKSGDLAGAEEPLRKALSITEAALGPNHETVGGILAMQAELMRRQHRRDEARRLEARSREVFRQSQSQTVSVWSLTDSR